MPLKYPPKKGQILLCDFSKGFAAPEMTKSSRPVVVLHSKHNIAIVVACSTVEPDRIEPHHYKIPRQSMPMTTHFFGKDTWVKGDMVYSVGFSRLDLVSVGKRQYFSQQFGKAQMNEIHRCVLHGIGMEFIAHHL